jgi:hypothetical protein
LVSVSGATLPKECIRYVSLLCVRADGLLILGHKSCEILLV